MSDNEQGNKLNIDEAAIVADLPPLPPIDGPAAASPGAPGQLPPAQKTPADIDVAEAVGLFCSVLFGILAARRGPHWELNEGEASQLGRATEPVLDKYMPGATFGPEVTLIAVTAMVVGPRLAKDNATQKTETPADTNAGEDRSIVHKGTAAAAGDTPAAVK